MNLHSKPVMTKMYPIKKGIVNISKDRTVLVVEHDMNFIESLDVEVVVLNEGSLLTRGSMKNIKKNKQVIDVYLGR